MDGDGVAEALELKRWRGGRRECRLALVVTVQSVMVAACLAITLYVYSQTEPHVRENPDIFVLFEPIADISGNTTLKFEKNKSNRLDVANNTKINIRCSGPYILHMDVCYQGLDNAPGNGTLELWVVGCKAPATRFYISANNTVCSGLLHTVYLRRKEEATLHLFSPGDNIKINNITVGLSYLMGQQCPI